jgi:hypothetical protein
VIDFLKPLTAFLRVGFKSYAHQMTEFNAAMAFNLGNAITGIYPDIEIDFTKAIVSRGNLQVALNPAAVAGLASQVNFTWDDNTGYGNGLATDKVLLVVYDPVKKMGEFILGGNTRTSGAQTFTLPEYYTGDEVQCYIAFGNDNQSVVSNSLYAGAVIVG